MWDDYSRIRWMYYYLNGDFFYTYVREDSWITKQDLYINKMAMTKKKRPRNLMYNSGIKLVYIAGTFMVLTAAFY